MGSAYRCTANTQINVPINTTLSLPYCDVAARCPLTILDLDPDMKWLGVGALSGLPLIRGGLHPCAAVHQPRQALGNLCNAHAS